MSISTASSAINAGIIILTCLVGYFVFQLYYAIQNNLDLARNKEIAVQLAGELMESTPHAMERYTIPTPELPPMSLLRRKV